METPTHHSIQIPHIGVTKYIPKELGNCDAEEFKKVCNLLWQWQTGYYTYDEFRVQAAYLFLNLKPGKRKINDIEKEALFANIYAISEVLDSFFEKDKDGKLDIKLNFVNNPVEFVQPFAVKLHGPKMRFVNTTWGQYEDALNLFHLYHANQETKYLYMLMATYYLEKGKAYKKERVEKQVLKFKTLVDFGQVYGFFLYFLAFQNYVTSSKVMVEGNIIDLSILFSQSGSGIKSSIPGLGAKALTFQLAESNVFGSTEKVRKENIWEVLLRLYDIRKRDLDYKAEQKSLENNKK
jgi:hypothetical protein